MLGMASVVAFGVVLAASDRFPIGPARIAERHPGPAVNLAVVGGGVALLVALFLASTAFSVPRS